MNILMVYGSYSGSTFLVSELIKEVLESNDHKVTMVNARESSPKALKDHDMLLVGTNSWLVDKVEGQPHPSVTRFLEELKDESPDVPYAAYGCGDSSYAHFCNGVTLVEESLDSMGLKQKVPSLRIDGYFFNEIDSRNQAEAWATVLVENL